jgi:hypothetical protein
MRLSCSFCSCLIRDCPDVMVSQKSKLSYDRRSFGQSFSISGHQPRPVTNFSFTTMEMFSDIRGFLLVGCPSWREDGPVIYLYNCYWSFPALSLLNRSLAGLMTISYCLIWGYVPSLSPLTTRRATVEAFYPACTQVRAQSTVCSVAGRVTFV